MKAFSLVLLGACLLGLSGCAGHRDLKAPCGPLALAGDPDCGPLKPLNVAALGAMYKNNRL